MKGEIFMDFENKYASKGVAGTALGIGIGALGLEALRGGGLGGLFGSGNVCPGYTRYDAEKDARIATLEADKKLLESNIYTDSKIADVYERLNLKIEGVKEELCAQRVYNATNTAAINCLNGQVAQLMALTKVVIPAANICPAPMPQYNSWTAPTAATTT
jgi:hypothetical protein